MVEHLLIIGGGIIGVCTAYYISQDERFRRGEIALAIVEASEIAGGSSGKAGGFLALDWHGTATSSLAELSYGLHQELAALLDGENVYGYRKLTSLTCRARVSQEPHEPSPNEALVDSDLQFRPRPPSKGVLHTKWLQGSAIENIEVVADENTTAQVHPEQFTKTLFKIAKDRGVQHITGQPRVWKKQDGSKSMTIDTPNGLQDIRADKIVLAAGPWTGRVASELFGVHIPISNLPGHSILIRPAKPLPAHAVFASIYGAEAEDFTASPELFVRPDGLVYIAGENTGPTLPRGTADVKIEADAIRKLVKASGAISDSLRDGVVELQQLCYRPVTAHGAPLVGVLNDEGDVFVAAGHGPWGITLGPGTGKVMAELVLNGFAKSANISQLAPRRYIKHQ